MSDHEKDRDNWVRLTLRLPPELHAEIVNESGLLSLNTTIVRLLQNALKVQGSERDSSEDRSAGSEETSAVDRATKQSAKTIEALSDKFLDELSKTVRESLREEMKALERRRSK